MNFRNEYGYAKTIPQGALRTLQHGQEIRVSAFRKALENVKTAGVTKVRCYNDKNTFVCSIFIGDALKCIQGWGAVKTLVVSCTDSGFNFTLPKEQKRANLIKNGYSPEKADELLKDAVETIYPLTKEGK